MLSPNAKINYRYRCKINEIQYDIQLFNINQEKIKIMINTKSPYSDDFTEYSNEYSLIQFQEITKYYNMFETIEEIFDDLSRTIQDKNFAISRNGNTLKFIIKININKDIKETEFILDKIKTIDLYSQKDNQYYCNTFASSKNSEMTKARTNYLEKSKRNIDISSIGELNNLLSDLKDRITVLENSQNKLMIEKNEELEKPKLYDNNYNVLNSETISAGLENILIRLNKLEKENNFKDKTIEQLENKLKYYESMDNMNNNYRLNTVPTFSSNLAGTHMSLNPFQNNFLIRPQLEQSFTIPKRLNQSAFVNRMTYYDDNKKKNRKNNKVKLSKSQIFSNNYNNNTDENNDYNNDDQKKNYYRSNSYYDKRISFKDNNSCNNNDNNYNNKQYNEKDTEQNNSIGIKSNSSISNHSNYREKLGIPTVPREDLKKYVNSRIIFTKKELRLLKNKFNQGNKKIHVFFDLLYRASTDGDYEEIIRDSIYDADQTLTLFYTYEGSRFGVYLQLKKTSSFLKKETLKEVPGTSFIVSLNNLRFFDIRPTKTSKTEYKDYLCFGRTFYLNKNGSNWLINTPKSNFLKKRCIIGDQKTEYINFDPEVIIGNKNDYHIKDVEIFHVVFEKDEDEKENEKYKKK